MNHFRYHLTIGLLLIAIGIGMVFHESRDPVLADTDTFDSETDVSNSSPTINQTPADDSVSTSPTDTASNVTFTGKAIDVNENNYYMAFCSSDQITHGGASAPTCENTNHTWAISSSTSSNSAISSITYTTTGNENLGTNGCTNDESCPWYAFVCDAVVGGSCFPANGSGDQGFALGTITFSDVPEDADTITVDGVTYEFDTAGDGISSGTEVDTAVSASEQDAAYELQSVEAGASSHMVVRGAVVYVYADSEGTGGNSIGMTEPDVNEGGSSSEIVLSDTTLSGGSVTGQSPFKINHTSTFGTVSVTDTSDGEINPGDTLRFTLAQADIADTDTDGTQDTISMYICTDATTAFDYSGNSCTNGSLICSDTSVNPTNTDATCDETGNTLVPPSDTHGTENFKVYVEDSHNFPGTGTNAQSYDIVNTKPTHSTPELDVHAPTLPNSIAYWQFEDGNTATAFDDETSNSNDASCTNCPDWTEEGYSGGAYDFNGTDDYIVSDWSDFTLSEHTISFWMKANSIDTSYHDLVGTQLNVDQNRFHLQSTDNSIIWHRPLGHASSLDSNIIPVADTWYHVVGTHDGTTAKVYVNGNLENSAAYGTSITSTGVWIGGTTEPFDGFIDEVHIYDRALTSGEITAIYNAYTTPGTTAYTDSNMDLSCKPITIADHDSDSTTTIYNWEKDSSSIAVLNMPFDSNVSSTTADAVLDYSGNTNHGTLGASTATPTWTSSGIKGGAYSFDGGDEIEVSTTSLIAQNDPKSIFVWIKIDYGTSQWSRIFNHDISNSKWVLALYGLSGGKYAIGGTPNNNTSGKYGGTTYLLDPDVWYYVGWTFDGTNWKIYVDGEEKVWTTSAGLAGFTDAGHVYIGKRTSYLFTGDIDEVLLYDFALSTEQVAQNYNNGKPLYNTIVNQEIAEGDASWQCKVTINDAQTVNPDSVTNSSNAINPSNSEPVQNIPSARAHALLDSSSAGYWRFEDGDITSNILDETTNSNDGSCTNCPTWTSEGAIGGGYEFDASSSTYILIAEDSSLTPSDDFSWSAWIKKGEDIGRQRIYYHNNLFNASDEPGLWIEFTSDDYFSFGYEDVNSVDYVLNSDSTITDQSFHHFVCVYEDSTKTSTIYIDGTYSNDNTFAGAHGIVDNPAYIGVRATSTGFDLPFDGIIDEVHIYDRDLSATEIANLYNSTSYAYASMDLGVGGRDIADADADDLYATVDWRESDTSIAVLNMSFNESVTSTTADAVPDYSSYGNHGTLAASTATPTWTNATTCGNDSGGCYSFDGGDYIVIDEHSSLDVTDEITLSAWVNPSSLSSDAIVVGKGYYTNASDNGGYFLRTGLIGGRSNELQLSLGNNNWDYVYKSSLMTTGSWQHIVGTWDGTTAKIYRNGTEITPDGSNSDLTSLKNTSQDAGIGYVNWGYSNDKFNGLIDNVQIYDRTLTLAQIQSMYNAGIPNYQNIAYGETAIGETWSSFVTLTEGNSESSATIESNELEILGFSTLPYEDPASTSTNPTDVGNNVVIKATANVTGASQWYLAICKTDAVTAGNNVAPTCDGGAWDVSDATTDKNSATATYTTLSGDSESEDWYAFACDKVASTATCSTSSQGTGDSGSPFAVNHVPEITTITIGDTSGGGGQNPASGTIETGDTIYFNAEITESDTDGTQDTVDMYVCETSGFTYGASPACTGVEICNVTGVDPSTTYAECDDSGNPQVPAGTSSGQKTVYVYIQDSHDFEDAGTNNSHSYTLSNTAPSFTAGPSDGGSSNTSPTNVDSSTTWTATADDDNEDDYWLIVCDSSDVTHNGTSVPTCDSNQLAISDGNDTADGTDPATASRTALIGDSQSNAWYAYVCDKIVGGSCTGPEQGTGDNGSPFEVNHRPVIGTVTIGPSYGDDSSVAPGNGSTGEVYFRVGVTDSDSSGSADTIDMHVCTTDSFTPGSGCDDTTLCSVTGVASSSNADCTDADLAPIPTVHGSNTVYIFLEDNHDFQDGDSTHNQTYDVTDVAPTVTSTTVDTTPAPAAGSYEAADWSAVVTDNNGDSDVTSVEGWFYDDTAINLTSGECTEDENDCYKDSTNCTLNASYGTNLEVQATCSANVWFNANASTGWAAHVNPVDETTTVTDGADSSPVEIVALQGITVVESSIAYSVVVIGGTSVKKETSIGNVGNVVIDVLLDGDAMTCQTSGTCGSSTIGVVQQRWYHTNVNFDWDDPETGAGPWILEDNAGSPPTGDGDGCLNRDIAVRDGHTETTTNESVYWKLRIPSIQASGDYSGLNTFGSTASTSCTGEQY